MAPTLPEATAGRRRGLRNRFILPWRQDAFGRLLREAVGGATVGVLLVGSVTAAILQVDSHDRRPLLNLGSEISRVGYYGAIGGLGGMVVSLLFRGWRRFVLVLWGAAVGVVCGVCISQVSFPARTGLANAIHIWVITVPSAFVFCLIGALAGLWLANRPTRKAEHDRRVQLMRRLSGRERVP